MTWLSLFCPVQSTEMFFCTGALYRAILTRQTHDGGRIQNGASAGSTYRVLLRQETDRARTHGCLFNLCSFLLFYPDRVPVNLPVGDLPNILHGVSMHTAMYDIEKAIEACKAFNNKYSNELELFAVSGNGTADVT